MRLTGRRWATAFAIAVLVHAGVLAVGLWHGSDPGAGITGPTAISVSLSQARGSAPSAAARPSGLPEAETVAAVETAVSAPIEEAVRTEAPAAAPPVAQAASADEPTPPLTARTMDAETAADAAAPDDAASVDPTMQAAVSEAPQAEAIAVSAMAVEMPVVESAPTKAPAMTLPARTPDADTAARDVAANDAASVDPTMQAAVSEAPQAEAIAVSAMAVEMPVVESAPTKAPAMTLPARTPDADTAARDVAANDAASVDPTMQAAIPEVFVSKTVTATENAAETPVAETAAVSSSETAKQALPPPDTSETKAIAPAEALEGPAPVETSKTVMQRAEDAGIPEPGKTSAEVPEAGKPTVADAVTDPPIEEVVSASPERVAPASQPSETIEDPAVTQVEPANEPDPPDAEAKLVEAVEASENPQSQRPVAVAAVGPGEEAAPEAISSSPPSADSDADRSAPPSATGASARLQTVGIQAVHDEYLRKVLTRIARFKRYPREARRDGVVGKVLVRFIILPDGSLRSPQLTDSSGDSRLDRAALEMLSRASPFPPIPPGLGASKLELSLPIEYSLSEKRRLF